MKSKGSAKRPADPIKDATLAALENILDPLIELMLDVGVTVQDLNGLVRARSVQIAARRLRDQSGRTSKSRISIVTGIPRADVARLLNPATPAVESKKSQHPARRVLEAWYNTPSYLTAAGEPMPLPIFGKLRSFDALVRRHGGGIPVRAMLDALTQMDAIEQDKNQFVRAKSRVPVSRGITPDAIAAIGDRTRDLLDTLTINLRRNEQPLFEATTVSNGVKIPMLNIIKCEIASQGSSFISGIDSLLHRTRKFKAKSSAHNAAADKADVESVRAGVTIYYFEDNTEIPQAGNPPAINRRTNLRRFQA